MSTLVIPDIHTKIDLAEVLVSEHGNGCDRIVFLGDYFDRSGDSPKVAAGVARWLAKSIEDPRRTHLVGNHDMPYLGDTERSVWWHETDGLSTGKYETVRPILQDIDPQKLEVAIEIDGWLLSHAGFAAYYLVGRTTREVLKQTSARYARVLEGDRDEFFLPGYARGGGAKFGGPTWLDWGYEFKPVPGWNQIVGHSVYHCPRAAILKDIKRQRRIERMEFSKENSETPRRKEGRSVNFCLDTKLSTVAIIDGPEVRLIWL